MTVTTARAGATGAAVTGGQPPAPRQLPVFWLALLAAPVAAGGNAPVLILSDMAASLGVRTAAATWLVTAFAWGLAVGTPLMAGLLRRRGIRTTVTVAALTVAAGTATVALAPWLPLALAGRAAQAVGGAGLVAVAMNLAGTARRMGVITSGFGVLGAFGPLLGQTLTATASWRLSLAVSALALLAVPAARRHAGPVPPPTGRFDGRGAALLLACVTALVLLPTAPLAALPVAVVAAPLLVRHLRRTPDGFTPTALLRSRPFRRAAAAALALSTSYFTLLFAVPALLADRAGLDDRAIGTGQLVAMLIGSALSWLLAAASPRLPRAAAYAILLGLGAFAAALAAFASTAPLLLLAIAAAIFTSTGANAVLSVYAAGGTPAPARPAALGLFVLGYQLGGALGPALAALLVLG